jgi:2-polyprenyl-6-methoxyphenol hydroxylase-like FAD-dependent oxidoreductase
MTWSTGAFVADRYREGRIFLVGDAAHLMPPYGGFGNTGIADAHNCLETAAVRFRETPDALLDTYESERQPITEFSQTRHAACRGRDRQILPAVRPVRPQSDHAGIPLPMATAGFDRELPIEDPAQPSGSPAPAPTLA